MAKKITQIEINGETYDVGGLKNIVKGVDSNYITTNVGVKTNDTQAVSATLQTCTIEGATETSDGLATAYNVKEAILSLNPNSHIQNSDKQIINGSNSVVAKEDKIVVDGDLLDVQCDSSFKGINIPLEQGDGSAQVNFSKRVDNIIEGTVVFLTSIQYSISFECIIFYNQWGVKISSIKHAKQNGQYLTQYGIAPAGTSYVIVKYRETTSGYGRASLKLGYNLNAAMSAIAEMTPPNYKITPNLEHGDGSEILNFTEVISMTGGTFVEFYCLQYQADTKVVIFRDEFNNEIGSLSLISGNGKNAVLTGYAPEATKSALFKYRESTYQGSFGKTKIILTISLPQVNDLQLKSNSNIPHIVFNGDSTGQGLDGALTRAMLNNEAQITRGSVGSENVLATAARQGAIPLLLLPFTIPQASVARWTNSTNSIVAEGNDPQVIYSSSLLYHTQYDNDGMPLTPSVSAYTKLHFAPTAPFYCVINGIKGYLYSLPEYHVENGTVVIDGTEYVNMYFHRSVAGEAVTISKVTEVIPSTSDWHDAYQVNLMGTNMGFTCYTNADYVLLGSNFDALVSAMGSRSAAYKEAALNLFDIQRRMARNAKDYLVVGFFCEVTGNCISQEFYETYENLCEREFGNHFFNARLYLKDQAWKDLNISLTEADRNNIAIGLPPWSLFDATGQPTTNPHLRNIVNKALANQVAQRIVELGWTVTFPVLYSNDN